MADFQLQIVTPEKVVFDDRVTSIIAPGSAGYLGVLAHHAPLLTTLTEGKLTIRQGDRVSVHRVTGGFLEVASNMATLLVDSFVGVGPEEEAAG